MTLRAGKTQKTKEMIMGRDTYRMWLYIYIEYLLDYI